MSDFAWLKVAGYMAFMQDNQIWFPHCLITEVAQTVVEVERDPPQRDPSSEVVASPTRLNAPVVCHERHTWMLAARRFDDTSLSVAC